MCAICGIVSKKGQDTIDPLMNMLNAMDHRGPDGVGMAWDHGICHATSVEELPEQIGNVQATRAMGHARLRITGITGAQPFVSENRTTLNFIYNGEIYNFRELLKRSFLYQKRFQTNNDGELLFRLLSENYRGDPAQAIMQTLPDLDGVYAMALMDSDAIAIYRDKMGIKQVYYGEDEKYMAFASERKALWEVGMKSKRLNPGELMSIQSDGLHTRKIEKLQPLPICIEDREEALEHYRDELFSAVEKRVVGHNKVGILFSGGVDSVLISLVAKLFCSNVIGYTGGVKGAPDLLHAAQAAEAIGIPLKINYLDTEKIAAMMPDVIEAIEDWGLMQVEVALPMFAAFQFAEADGIRVMLTGQGADELFAGYEWYPPILHKQGDDALIKSMWNDLSNLYRDTLEREDKISMWHSIELRVPFLDLDVISKTMRISPFLKLENGNTGYDKLGKRLHRELAYRLGVPRQIAYRPKDGAQHGSGIHNTVEQLARQLDVDQPEKRLSFDETETRGSAFRHGGIDINGTSYGNNQAQNLVDAIAVRVFES